MTERLDALLAAQDRLKIARLVAQGRVDRLRHGPDELLRFLLTGDTEAHSAPLEVGITAKLDALAFVAGLTGISDLLGSSASLTQSVRELEDWLRDPVLRPIPRHYTVEFFPPEFAEEAQKRQNPVGRRLGRRVRVANPPANWSTTSWPEDAL